MSSLVQGTLKPGAQQNQTAITLAEEEQRSAELHQMRVLGRQQRSRSSTSGTEDQPASKMKRKLKCVIMKKDSPLKRDVFLEQTARPSLPISLPSGTSSRSSTPHTITRPMLGEQQAMIDISQSVISNMPHVPMDFELPVPEMAREVSLVPQETTYRTQQRTSIVQPTSTSTSLPDDPVFPELRQVLLPYSPPQEHNYGTPKDLVLTSSCIQLSYLDHNENVGRPVKIAADGSEVLELRWSKAVKDYRMKNVYVPKTFNFRAQLMTDILRRALMVVEPTPKVCVEA